MGRGQLTDDIQNIAVLFLGRKMSTTELRLIPYITYIIVNDQIIDVRKCNEDDRKVLRLWKDAGYMEGGSSGLSITKEFWDFMNEIIWLGYVIYDE